MTETSMPAGDFGHPDPHDIEAEQAVLGSMMLSSAAAEACLQALSAEDFYRPAHQVIFAVVTDLIRSGECADVITAKDRLEASGDIGRCGGAVYLHTLIASVPAPASASHYARIVRERAVRRRLLLAGRRILQLATASEAGEAHGLTERALRELEDVRDSGLGDGLTVQTISEFLDVPAEEDEYDWIVPGLLERGDRMILTGMEGAGKSTLFRQLAVTIAAGIHPFTSEAIEPRRVMLIDCENGARHMRRKLRPLRAQARLLGRPVDEQNLWIECRPARMDLALDKDVSWLLRQVAAVRPDIVMVGPLYRLAPRALQTDDEAAPVLAALDMIRARDACVLLEAHAGHATGPGGRRDTRPRGSSAFLGWPEFGYGLRWSDDDHARDERTVDVVAWRGDRDERDWPEMLTAGGEWPWRTYTRPLQIKAPAWGGFNDAAAN
jgi:DnaB-like helicase N terminal domain/AAA domain